MVHLLKIFIKNTHPCTHFPHHIYMQPFEKSLADNPGPMVVFATPGMLHGGLSLQIFRKWCTNANNVVGFTSAPSTNSMKFLATKHSNPSNLIYEIIHTGNA